MKSKENADAGQVPLRGILKKPKQKEETKGHPSEKEQFNMADMSHPKLTEGDGHAGDESRRADTGEIIDEKIYCQSAEDKRQDEQDIYKKRQGGLKSGPEEKRAGPDRKDNPR